MSQASTMSAKSLDIIWSGKRQLKLSAGKNRLPSIGTKCFKANWVTYSSYLGFGVSIFIILWILLKFFILLLTYQPTLNGFPDNKRLKVCSSPADNPVNVRSPWPKPLGSRSLQSIHHLWWLWLLMCFQCIQSLSSILHTIGTTVDHV